jgi:hypothetical protein
MIKNNFVKLAMTAGIFLSTSLVHAQEKEWETIFNGNNLDGWVMKFSGYELGVNYKDTFRAGDGVMSVNYDQYDTFKEEFGHIFYKEKYSNYNFSLEYRFVGDQVPDGPDWAYRNNGIMAHSQDPKTITLHQDFPTSIEIQLLGGAPTGERTTGNMCSPGSHISMGGEVITQHCINSNSKTYRGDQWVRIDVEVRNSKVLRHKINGELVMEYQDIQIDASDETIPMQIFNQGTPLEEGYISLQAESHNTEFRNIMIQNLDE